MIASTLAISGPAAAVVGVTTDRIGGDNRYGTAGLIADEAFTAPVADILLASGLNFPDALAGNALAGTIDGPILLTNPDSLSPEAAASIQALADADTTVHILGGEAAVSAAVQTEVAALGVATNRFGGSDRFETAADIAEFVDENATIPGLNGTKTVIVATGLDFPDALAAGPLAYVGPHPILLVRPDLVPAATSAAITNIGADEVIILGGEAAVSAAVEVELETLTGNDAVRLAGDNRWGTAAEVADAALASFGFAGAEVLLANGRVAADALAGGPLGGVMRAPILLTGTLPAETAAWLTANNDVVANITALGGPDAIDEATLAAAAAAAELPAPTTNQTFVVDPAAPAFNTVSTTTGDNQNRGEREYTVDVGDATSVDIALVNQANVTVDANGVVSFRDTDTDQNRADGLGATLAVIETVNGVGITASDYVNNVAAPGGTVTFTIDSTTPNQAVIPVVFSDADNNNQLNLDADNLPTEAFGIGGTKLWIPSEAGFGTFTNQVAVVALQIADFFTAADFGLTGPNPNAGGRTFNYGEGDIYRYDSGIAPVVTISQTQFENWLSGFSADQLANDCTPGVVCGDTLDVNYNDDGPSTFTIISDVPLAPIDVTATVVNADPGVDSSDDDIEVSWTAPSNPDVLGYRIFRAVVPTTGSPVFGQVGTVAGKSNTSFNDLNVPVSGASTDYAYRVLAVNTDQLPWSGMAPALPFPDGLSSPDSNTALVTITSAAFTARPISSTTFFAEGPGQCDPGPPLVAPCTIAQGDDTALDKGDSLDITFYNVGAGLELTSPSITVRDSDGSTTTISETNAQFSLGVASGGTQTLGIVMTANPTISANGSNTDFDTDMPVSFVSSSGIANSNGAWNLPASGCDDQCPALAALPLENRVFGTEPVPPPPWGNFDLPAAVPAADITANPATDQITVLSTATVIAANEPFAVFDGLGNQIASGTFTGANTTVTTSPGFEPGDRLFFVYTDLAGTTFPRHPSETTQIDNPSDIPTVNIVTAAEALPADLLDITWIDNNLPDPVGITQVGPASNYRVYDAANNVLLATGEATSGSADGDGVIRVDFNANLAAGNYTLRVAANTVQDPNNLPNEVQVFPFTLTASTDIVVPGPPIIVSTSLDPVADTITVTYNETMVDCGLPSAYTFDDTSSANVDGAANISILTGPSSTVCQLGFGVDLQPESNGTLTYSQPALAADRAVDTEGVFAESQTVPVNDTTPVTLTTAAQLSSLAPNQNVATLTFSEPVLCSSVDNGDFTVSVDGDSRSVTSDTCAAGSVEQFRITFNGAAPLDNAVVNVTLLEDTVTDQNGVLNNQSVAGYTYDSALGTVTGAPLSTSVTATDNGDGVLGAGDTIVILFDQEMVPDNANAQINFEEVGGPCGEILLNPGEGVYTFSTTNVLNDTLTVDVLSLSSCGGVAGDFDVIPAFTINIVDADEGLLWDLAGSPDITFNIS